MYQSKAAAEEGRMGGGCGVLVGIPATSLENSVHLYAVTNAHVVERGGTVVRATRGSGEPWVFEMTAGDWILHPDGEDVAVCWLRTVPTNPGELGMNTSQTFNWVWEESLVEAKELGQLSYRTGPWAGAPIGPGEEIFSVSRFIGFDGTERNQPTVRFGNLSSRATVGISQLPGRDHDQASLLIEARSLGGCSGAPVFAYRPRAGSDGVVRAVFDFDALLLGIGWGHIKHPQDENLEYEVELESPGRPTPGRYNSGMMAVIPAWMISQLLNDERVIKIRKAQEDDKTAAGGSAELDFIEEGTVDKTTYLLGKLLQVPKDEPED
jgi:hypothetical protein